MTSFEPPGPPLHYQNARLLFNSQKLDEFINRYQTPFYLYDLNILKDNFLNFQEVIQKKLSAKSLICYAVKANDHVEFLTTLSQIGSGADVVSIGELKKCIKSNFSPKKIVFSGVGKTDQEIEEALDLTNGNLKSVNIESLDELISLNAIAKRKNLTQDISFRFNPSTPGKTHEHISTGGSEHKFGLNESEIIEGLQLLKEMCNVKLRGLSIHIGSQLTSLKETDLALKKMLELSNSIPDLIYLNVGGGLGIKYTQDQSDLIPLHQYIDTINNLTSKKDSGKIEIIFEPGRYLSGNSGILITKIIRSKRNFRIVDAGMNDFMRPCLYGAYHEIFPLTRKDGTEIVTIAGPICETGDFFGKNIEITKTEKNDYLIISNVGAYGKTLANTYNSRPLISEVFIPIS